MTLILLAPKFGQSDGEFGLIVIGGWSIVRHHAGRRRGGHRHRRGSGDPEFLLDSLDQIGQVHHAHVLDGVQYFLIYCP